MALSKRPFTPGTNLPNVSSVISQSVQGEGPGPLPALQSISATTEQLIVNPFNTAIALSCAIPPNTNLEQQPLNFNWSGYIKTTANGNITLKIYSGTSLSGTLLGSSGAIAQNNLAAPFWAKMELIYDSVSGKLDGTVKFFLNHGIVAEVAISNTITGVSNTTDPVAQFCVSCTSSGASGANLTTINTQDLSCG